MENTRELTVADFKHFFHAVHGVPEPFPWQIRLLECLVENSGQARIWPSLLDLPTGSGKTSTIDIALFHLALEAQKKEARRAPLRIAFIVDRRLIVDDAFERAKKLAKELQSALINPNADPIVRLVACALQSLAGTGEANIPVQPPLIAQKLRGGMPREDDWARTPVQPTIICSTVDQVGSRLLFRGYGVSPVMRPIHAGLLGSDTLILLDEAHLSQPFRQTLEEIAYFRAPDTAPLETSFLTATPGEQSDACFQLDTKDREHPILHRRLHASKCVTLVEISGKQGISTEQRRVESVIDYIRKTLQCLRGSGIENPAIGVVVNRVARARSAFKHLHKELGDAANITLLIGPVRAVDRDKGLSYLSSIRTGHENRDFQKPLIIVATQTIEVGADIDLDGLVTEAAPLDSLRQRFGRLNRDGRPISALGFLLAHKDDLSTKTDDPVYGKRIAETWNLLQNVQRENVVDFGIQAFDDLALDAAAIAQVIAEREDAPVILPAYIDLWAQTSPIPNADPEPALFLHGPRRTIRNVQIIWRADIEAGWDWERGNPEEIEVQGTQKLLDALPPRAEEAIEVPLHAARAWLRNNGSHIDVADTVEKITEEHGMKASLGGRCALRWSASNKECELIQARELQPDDTIIVPLRYGGCDAWGWDPDSRIPVKDVADQAAEPYRSRRFAVRIMPEIIAQGTHNPDEAYLEKNITAVEVALRELLDGHIEDTPKRLLERLIQNGDFFPQSLLISLRAMKDNKRRPERVVVYQRNGPDPLGVIFIAPRGIRSSEKPEEIATSFTESDRIASFLGRAQSLDDHAQEVKQWAENFAKRACLPSKVAADIALAAYLHDAGKVDPRFQAFLAGADPLGADPNHVLAKSGHDSFPRGAWERAGFKKDQQWRHEALSVRLAQRHPNFEQANDPALVLWLIGVHHGYGRPLFPEMEDSSQEQAIDLPNALGCEWGSEHAPGPDSFDFLFTEPSSSLPMEWAQMFKQLRHRYGTWGLARLEAFVRLADHRASELAGRLPCDAQDAQKEEAL